MKVYIVLKDMVDYQEHMGVFDSREKVNQYISDLHGVDYPLPGTPNSNYWVKELNLNVGIIK